MFENIGTIIPVWNLRRVDPGYLYIIENEGLYKFGKTKNIGDRFRSAKTWLPDMSLVGIKPFWGISHHERRLHVGLAMYWYSGEWFKFENEIELRDMIVDGFTAFSDIDPDRNSIDFPYWYNGINMAEFEMEMSYKKLTLPKFRKEISGNRKSD